MSPSPNFDVDELRRRRLLAQSMEAAPNIPRPGERPMTPAEERFNSVALAAPVETDPQYKPSLLRNILAGVAAGSTGYLQGPKAGMEIGQNIQRMPFTRAHDQWSQQVTDAEKPLLLEQERRSEDLKTRQADIDAENARANTVRARSGIMWRPQTEEEALGEARAHIAPRTPTAEEAAQTFFKNDPEGFKRYQELKNPNRSLSLTDRKELADYEAAIAAKADQRRSGLRMNEQTHAAGLRPTQSESPITETHRQRMAVERILQRAPQYKDYVEEVETTSGTYWRIKRPDEIRGIFRRWTPQDAINYKKFQNAVALEMESIRSIPRTTGDYPGLEPANEEEEQ